MRIARAAKSLGATSLSVCAPEDVTSPHVEYADEHVVLEKGTTAIAPYLDIERLTKVAVENDVDFVHPGNDIITICLICCCYFNFMISNMHMICFLSDNESSLLNQIFCALYTYTGYGFLSESAPFAQSLVSSGINWVGPPPEVLQLFGDKIQARALAQRSNVPVVKGSGNLISGDECLDILNNGDVRLPAIMKVSCFIHAPFTFLSNCIS